MRGAWFSRSLRLRWLSVAFVAILAALAVSWFAMTLLFQRHIERRFEEELTRYARQLVAGLSFDASGRLVVDGAPADARFDEPRSGLYWALTRTVSDPVGDAAQPHERTDGRDPGAQLRTDSAPVEGLKSRSLWEQQLPPSPGASTGDWSVRVARGPFDQQVLLVERIVQPGSESAKVLVQVAVDYAAVLDARREFGSDLALYLALLWVVLAGAAWIQVEVALRPFARVRRELEMLKSNPSERLNADHPKEIQPLTNAINALAEAREKDLGAARRRAADLAHGLKTPLAALSAGSRRARESGAADVANGLDRAIASATAAVNAELARSRAATIRDAAQSARTAAQPVIEQVIGVIERTDFGADRVFEVEVPEAVVVPVPAEDLAELLGALIENAARFARRRVRVTGTHGNNTSTLLIEDDGPGLGPSRAEQILSRRGRLDEAGPSTGLGLSIARDLAEATQGHLSLGAAALGGLQVKIEWPALQM